MAHACWRAFRLWCGDVVTADAIVELLEMYRDAPYRVVSVSQAVPVYPFRLRRSGGVSRARSDVQGTALVDQEFCAPTHPGIRVR
jgi:hypothetical protein